jgi:hypothetical protein
LNVTVCSIHLANFQLQILEIKPAADALCQLLAQLICCWCIGFRVGLAVGSSSSFAHLPECCQGGTGGAVGALGTAAAAAAVAQGCLDLPMQCQSWSKMLQQQVSSWSLVQ